MNSKRIKLFTKSVADFVGASAGGVASAENALNYFVDIYSSTAKAKFDEAVDVVFSLGIDAKRTDQTVRGMATLPNGTGKTIFVVVFAKGAAAEKALAAGADVVGADELIPSIIDGSLVPGVCIATPDMMPVVSKLGKVLGSKGLMPNPKLGTVTLTPEVAVVDAKKGQVKFRNEKNGLVHAAIGKLSMGDSALYQNLLALLKVVLDSKPDGSKGDYIKQIYLTTTMGPSIVIDHKLLLNNV